MVATRSRTPVRGAKKEAKAATQKTPAAKKKAPAAKKKAPAAKKAVTPKRGRGRAKKSQKEEPEEPAKEPVKPVDPVHIEPVGASVDAMKAPSQSSTVPYYSGRVNSVQANQGILNLKPWLPLAVEPAPVKPAKPSEPAQEGVATSTVNPAVKTSGKISGRFWKHKEARCVGAWVPVLFLDPTHRGQRACQLVAPDAVVPAPCGFGLQQPLFFSYVPCCSRHSSIKKSTKSKTKDARWKAVRKSGPTMRQRRAVLCALCAAVCLDRMLFAVPVPVPVPAPACLASLLLIILCATPFHPVPFSEDGA